MKKHNGIISLWKFLFCLMITIYHGRLFATGTEHIFLPKGYIAVEFFFLVSGYLLAASTLTKNSNLNENLGKSTTTFILKKFKSLFPYVFICYIITLVVMSVYGEITIKNIIFSIFELLFINMAGFRTTSVNSITWYISSMLISMIVIYPLLKKYKHNYAYIAAPLIVILIGGWLNYNSSTLTVPYEWTGFVYKGLIRAFFELNLGIVIFMMSQKIKTINFTKFGKLVLTLVELTGFITPFVIYELKISTIYDYVILLFLTISIMLAFSETTLEYNFLNNKISYYLEKLTLPLYLCQVAIRKIVLNNSLFTNMTYLNKLSIYLVIVLILSNILVFLIEKLKEKNFYIPKVKKIFIYD